MSSDSSQVPDGNHMETSMPHTSKRKRSQDTILPTPSSTDDCDGKRIRLRIATNISPGRALSDSSTQRARLDTVSSSDSESSLDSLFDDVHPVRPACYLGASLQPASRNAPPIPGLFIPSVLLPLDLADEVLRICTDTYFRQQNINQVMLFGRALPEGTSQSGLPPILNSLLSTVCELLRGKLPAETHSLLFPPPEAPIRARQAIVNLYNSGEGISPHVDLLKRFDDGIIGISFGSGCVMNFRKQRSVDPDEAKADEAYEQSYNKSNEWDLYLPERSIIVLSGDARYKWTHGIEGRTQDLVESANDNEGVECIERGVRMSVTFRWLLPGAEIVGEPE